MAVLNNEVKVIEQINVSPSPGSVPTTSLPLTFFDVPWLLFPQMQRPYFYVFPYSTDYFLETLLPTLKHSLSLTLQHFFLFAADLVCPPPPAKPHFLFTDGESSVSLTFAESTADFDFLSANHPRPVRALDPFVPKLAPTRREKGDKRVGPVMALQVTIFPNSGICIGVRFHHAAADGRAFHHFMKSWALLCKTGGDLTPLDRDLQLPSHARTAVKDPYGLELEFLKTWRRFELTWNNNDHEDASRPVLDCHADNVRATFVLSRVHIDELKSSIANQILGDDHKYNAKSFFISSFVATCALTWVCLAKSEEMVPSNEDDDEPYYFAFVADCRSRLEFSLPVTYFGNCLTVCFASVKRKELLGENGIFTAAKAIKKEVGELECKALNEEENWVMKFQKINEIRWRHVTVIGSPKFGVYEADFGWGKPKKTEPVHFSDATTISLAESRDEKGGVEVGMALSRDRMSRFSSVLEEILNGVGLN